MIARPLPLPPPYTPPAPLRGGRAGRIAVIDRRKANLRRRYRALTSVCAWITGVTAVVMVYLMLLADVSHLHYEAAKALEERAHLQDLTMGLDDKIAHLRSRDRLALVAQRLGMHDPGAYAVVRLPQPELLAERGNGLAFLSAIIGRLR